LMTVNGIWDFLSFDYARWSSPSWFERGGGGVQPPGPAGFVYMPS
jgi:hypothetical protein